MRIDPSLSRTHSPSPSRFCGLIVRKSVIVLSTIGIIQTEGAFHQSFSSYEFMSFWKQGPVDGEVVEVTIHGFKHTAI